MKITIAINITEKLWRTRPKITQQIRSLFKSIIPKTPLQNIIKTKVIANIEISILLTNDQQIKELNQSYRQKDKATNVLSFPLLDCKKIKNGNLANLDLANNKIANEIILGDIALSYQTICQEALQQNKTFDHHLTHLIIHSLLHLIGFDHQRISEAKIMEELEIRILADLNIKNPYSKTLKTCRKSP